MSLDLYMKCESCENDLGSINITYNVSSMWKRVRPEDDNMIPIEGMIGAFALKILKEAKEKLSVTNCDDLEPSNGWGSKAGLIKAIDQCIELSEKHPTGHWKAWR